MKSDDTKTLEPLAIRCAEVADADKVRYRVYRTPTDFVAVIAESALMAMRVSEISNPYRIVRDLPMNGLIVPVDRMQKNQDTEKKKSFRALKITSEESPVFVAAMNENPSPASQGFTPMQVRDFQLSGKPKLSVMSPAVSMNAIAMPVAPPVAMEQPLPQAPDVQSPGDVLSPDEVDRLLKS